MQNNMLESKPTLGLVVTGKVLEYVLNNDVLEPVFLNVILYAKVGEAPRECRVVWCLLGETMCAFGAFGVCVCVIWCVCLLNVIFCCILLTELAAPPAAAAQTCASCDHRRHPLQQ